jgi:hypothetical protein
VARALVDGPVAARRPFEAARGAHAGAGEHRAEGRLDERHHRDDLEALLARDGEGVEVHEREVGPARRQQARGVGAPPGADPQVHALALVELPGAGHVDAGVDAAGGAVEDQPHLRAVVRQRPPAGREGQQEREDDTDQAAHAQQCD